MPVLVVPVVNVGVLVHHLVVGVLVIVALGEMQIRSQPHQGGGDQERARHRLAKCGGGDGPPMNGAVEK